MLMYDSIDRKTETLDDITKDAAQLLCLLKARLALSESVNRKQASARARDLLDFTSDASLHTTIHHWYTQLRHYTISQQPDGSVRFDGSVITAELTTFLAIARTLQTGDLRRTFEEASKLRKTAHVRAIRHYQTSRKAWEKYRDKWEIEYLPDPEEYTEDYVSVHGYE